jgi:hypothetical protein
VDCKFSSEQSRLFHIFNQASFNSRANFQLSHLLLSTIVQQTISHNHPQVFPEEQNLLSSVNLLTTHRTTDHAPPQNRNPAGWCRRPPKCRHQSLRPPREDTLRARPAAPATATDDAASPIPSCRSAGSQIALAIRQPRRLLPTPALL